MHPPNSLDVMGENLRRSGDDHIKITRITLKITHERLHRGARRLAVNRPNRIGPGSGTAIRQIITVHASHNNVPQAERGDGRRDRTRLAGVDRQGFARADIAESTRSRADVAKNHDGCGAPGPAFTNVGTGCFLTDCVQPLFGHQRSKPLVPLATRHLGPDPAGLPRDHQRVRLGVVSENPIAQGHQSRSGGCSGGISPKGSNMAWRGRVGHQGAMILPPERVWIEEEMVQQTQRWWSMKSDTPLSNRREGIVLSPWWG